MRDLVAIEPTVSAGAEETAGPAGVKTINDLVIASVKTINDLAVASVKTISDIA